MSVPNPLISVVGDSTPDEPTSSPLADLKAALAKSTKSKTVTLPVPERGEEWTVKYSTAIPYETVNEWLKKATSKDDDFDQLRFSCLCLAATCVEIVTEGTVWRDDAGVALTFRSKGLMEALGVDSDFGAIRALYQADGDVGKSANAVMASAGYGGELKPVDPT